jgi:hypothetical protein
VFGATSNCSFLDVGHHPATCTSEQFMCADGSCIEIIMKCDGQMQCVDGSDETEIFG